MTLPGNSDLARLLRADVRPLENEQFVLTLAEAARSSTPVPVRRRARLGVVKVGAVVGFVAATTVGAAYASDLFTPPTPTDSSPTAPATDEPTDRERQNRGPRTTDDPVEVTPSPATVTQSSEPDGAPTEVDEQSPAGDDITDGAPSDGTDDEQTPAGSATEQPPHQSDSGPEDDDSGHDEDVSEDDSQGEPDSDDNPGPDDDSDVDQEDSGPASDLDEDSGEPGLEGAASSDDD